MSPEPALPSALKCAAAEAALVVIDVQQRLGDAMPAKVLNRVMVNTALLARAAGMLGVPVARSEQYPAGLGSTLETVERALPTSTVSFEKVAFSCCAAEGFLATIDRFGSRQIVLAGMEAHVCVLQTALDLRAAGLEVFTVEDAICSRRLENYQNAIDRMRQCGIHVVSAESVVFEWLGGADHEHFKALQRLLR